MSTALDLTQSADAPLAADRPSPLAADTPSPSRERLVSGWLAAANLAGALAALLLTSALLDRELTAAAPLLLLVWVGAAALGLSGPGAQRLGRSTVDEIGSVLVLFAAFCWLVLVAFDVFGLHAPRTSVLVVLWGASALLVLAARAAARSFVRSRPGFRQRTIVVGAGEVGQLLVRKLRHHPELGLDVVGVVDAAPRGRRADVEELTVVGGLEDLRDLVARLGVERVVVAFSSDSDGHVLETLRRIGGLGVQIDVVPRLFDALAPNALLDSIEGLPLISIPARRQSDGYAVAKRVVDIIGAVLGLALLAPLGLVIALRIKLDSPGPIFFKQTRYGLGMREFTSLKFRTMKVGTPAERHSEYIRASMNGATPPDARGLFKLSQDDAVTSVGRWLRRTSLDELPQLYNILRGDMSLVGPRPCIPYEVEHFSPHHFERFSVPGGLTGLWQVTARAHATFGEALEMDVAYARSCSLALDLRLLLLTPVRILDGSLTQ